MSRSLNVVVIDKIRKDTSLQQQVTLTCNEFSWCCPLNPDAVQPDYGVLTITYLPQQYLVETKSLKMYLQQFRCYDSFVEELSVRILTDLVYYLHPKAITVELAQNSRGGIQNTTTVKYDDSDTHSRSEMEKYTPELGFDVTAWPLVKAEARETNPVCNNCSENYLVGRTGYGSVKDPKEIVKLQKQGQLSVLEAYDLIAKL